jgi:isopentenyl diphosphate isomerase/L-lactate dehydrogenase-like FMN-dependent dehydrogenase
VSNHGGRELDQGVGSIDVLPEVVEAVGGRALVTVDGGIYRGTDVVKALILGADVVSVGRLYIYGLAAAGGPGVVRLFEILRTRFMSTVSSRTSTCRAKRIRKPRLAVLERGDSALRQCGPAVDQP